MKRLPEGSRESGAGLPGECYFKGIWLRGREIAVPFMAVSFTVWLVLVPLLILIVFSFRLGTPWSPGTFTFQHYIVAYTSPETYTIFLNTAAMAGLSTLISVGIALVFAFLTERTDMPLRNLAWVLMLIPMAVPSLLFAIAWTFLLSPKIGLFNVWLRTLMGVFGIELTEGPLNIYSLGGMIFLEGLRGVTTAFLMFAGAFRAMDPSLEEASAVSGASNLTTFFRMFVPLLAPALLAASTYTFMTNLESLEIPIVIGLPAGIYVFPTYIYFTTQKFTPPQYGLSAALSATFIIVSVLLVYMYFRVAGEASRFATVTGKGYRPRIIQLGRWRYPALGLYLAYFFLTIAAPACALVFRSLLRYYTTPSWNALSSLTFENYREIISAEDTIRVGLNTLLVSLGAATLTMMLSLMVAWVVVRKKFKGRVLLDGIFFLPHSLPGVIIGIALIFLFVQAPLSHLQLYGTLWLVMLGLTVTYIAFGTRTMNAAVAQIHRELEEAGEVSGATWTTILRTILLPLLLPAFISGWIWIASHSLRAFSVPLMLSTRKSMVLSVIMWRLWEDGYPGQTTALGVLLILALMVLTLAGRVLVVRMSLRDKT